MTIFFLVRNFEEISKLKNYFEAYSPLRFTFELKLKKTDFLDLANQRDSNQRETVVFTKQTNTNECKLQNFMS